MRQLVYYEWKVSVNVNVPENEFNYDLGAMLIGLFETAVNAAASRAAILSNQKYVQGFKKKKQTRKS